MKLNGEKGKRGTIGICPQCGTSGEIVWSWVTDVSKCKCGWSNEEVKNDSIIKKLAKEDVVEVVRCKDCNYCNEYTKWNGANYLGCSHLAELCDGQVVEVRANDFCSWGEGRLNDD